MENNIVNNEVIAERISELVKNIEVKTSDYAKEIECDIKDLELVYEDINEFIKHLKNHKSSIKSISELYNTLLSFKKMITDLRLTKYKINEQDIKVIKSLLDSMIKMKNMTNQENESSEANIDISQLIKSINK